MLSLLRIRDFALIEELGIEFGKGLNVITGETGAGKSIVINALGLILGEKARPEDIRSGAQRTAVEAVFEASEGELLVRREVSPSGKGKILINDEMIQRSKLKDIGDKLVDIHGQHTHQSLLRIANHIDLLDGLGKLISLRQEVESEFEGYLRLKKELGNLKEELSEREKRTDLLKFQIEEIEGASPEITEEEKLLHECTLLRNAESLFRLSDEVHKILDEDELEIPSIRTRLNFILNSLRQLAQIDEKTRPLLSQLESASAALEDISFELRSYRDGIDFNQERLAQIEERLDILGRIKRKYGGSLQEALKYLDGLKSELSRMERGEERLQELTREIEEVSSRLIDKSLALSKKREKVARKLEKDVEGELFYLGMKEAHFKVDIREKKNGEGVGGILDCGLRIADCESKDGAKRNQEEILMVDSKGCDEVEFLISPNPGEGLKPLAKIASGGELSRIMLALKGILAKVDKIPVLIFDEVDVGIGGRMAQVVGERLSSLAQSHQVICITHLPQIASLANMHFRAEKSTAKGRTTTLIRSLKKKERVEEIARMLGGERVSEITLKQAREMIGE